MNFNFVVDFHSFFNPLFDFVFDAFFLRRWSCGHVLPGFSEKMKHFKNPDPL